MAFFNEQAEKSTKKHCCSLAIYPIHLFLRSNLQEIGYCSLGNCKNRGVADLPAEME